MEDRLMDDLVKPKPNYKIISELQNYQLELKRLMTTNGQKIADFSGTQLLQTYMRICKILGPRQL